MFRNTFRDYFKKTETKPKKKQNKTKNKRRVMISVLGVDSQERVNTLQLSKFGVNNGSRRRPFAVVTL